MWSEVGGGGSGEVVEGGSGEVVEGGSGERGDNVCEDCKEEEEVGHDSRYLVWETMLMVHTACGVEVIMGS